MVVHIVGGCKQVFKLFKVKYTHLLVACRLVMDTSQDNLAAHRSQQNFLTAASKVVTGTSKE
jgi:hypothetical protein